MLPKFVSHPVPLNFIILIFFKRINYFFLHFFKNYHKFSYQLKELEN